LRGFPAYVDKAIQVSHAWIKHQAERALSLSKRAFFCPATSSGHGGSVNWMMFESLCYADASQIILRV